MDHSFETGIITDKIDEFFDRHDIEVEVSVTALGSGLFNVTAVHGDKRLGTVRTYYSVRIKNGNELEFL